jgi:hypothetical protein
MSGPTMASTDHTDRDGRTAAVQAAYYEVMTEATTTFRGLAVLDYLYGEVWTRPTLSRRWGRRVRAMLGRSGRGWRGRADPVWGRANSPDAVAVTGAHTSAAERARTSSRSARRAADSPTMPGWVVTQNRLSATWASSRAPASSAVMPRSASIVRIAWS